MHFPFTMLTFRSGIILDMLCQERQSENGSIVTCLAAEAPLALWSEMEMTREGGDEAMVDCVHKIDALEVLVRVSLAWGSAGSQKRAVAVPGDGRGDVGATGKEEKLKTWTD